MEDNMQNNTLEGAEKTNGTVISPTVADTAQLGKICPFCKSEIKDGDEVIVCPACGIPHHKGCWEENKGCTTFGCKEQHYEAQGTNPTDVCPNCGATLGDGQMFCPKCGVPKGGVTSNVCGKCGTELQEGQEFCPKCGQKAGLIVDTNVNSAINQFNETLNKTNEKKKKKSKVLPIVLAIVLLVVGVGGYFTYSTIQEKNKEEAIATYVSNAKTFCSDILTAGGKMETIGNKIQSNWQTYIYDNGYYYEIYDSIEDAVYSAQKDQSSNISAVESSKSEIESLYSKLLKVPNGSDLDEVKSAVQDLYNAYTDMYDCVMDVTGNYSQYTSNFGDCDNAVSKKLNTLTNLLKAYE